MNYVVYGMASSGNCHKVKMALDHLRLPYQWREIDTLKGETRTPSFLAMNPNGQVPVLAVDEKTYLPQSNAILWYLGEGTPLVPEDRFQRARVLQWMFFEQYSHEPNIAVVRFWVAYSGAPPADAEVEAKRRAGYAALDAMERHLSDRAFLVGERFTIADISLYAYTHVADEGGFDLTRYPAIRAWLDRVAGQPVHAPITA